MLAISNLSSSELHQVANEARILAHRKACDELLQKLRDSERGSPGLALLADTVGKALGLIGYQCAKFKEWLLTNGMDGLKLIFKIVNKVRAMMDCFETAGQIGTQVMKMLVAESKELSK